LVWEIEGKAATVFMMTFAYCSTYYMLYFKTGAYQKDLLLLLEKNVVHRGEEQLLDCTAPKLLLLLLLLQGGDPV
jgi:hypothetical protein